MVHFGNGSRMDYYRMLYPWYRRWRKSIFEHAAYAEHLRAGGVIKVVNPYDLKDDDLVGCGGGAGSPTVGIEKLQGDE